MVAAVRHPVARLFLGLASDQRLAVLTVLNRHGGTTTVRRISRELGLHDSATQRSLTSLAGYGLAEQLTEPRPWHPAVWQITPLARDLIGVAVRWMDERQAA